MSFRYTKRMLSFHCNAIWYDLCTKCLSATNGFRLVWLVIPNVPGLSGRYYCFQENLSRTTGTSRRILRPNTKGEFEVKAVEMFAISTKG